MPKLNPDTHQSIVQASAAGLINLLHTIYPDMEYLREPTAAQGSLLAYLETKLDATKALSVEELSLTRSNKSILATIQLIDYVCKDNSPFSPENKVRILQAIKTIASQYPGASWNDQEKQWSTNRFYDAATQQEVLQITPPAEALNLACTALMDNSRFDSKAEDLDLRLLSASTQLLQLRQDQERESRAKCAAGLQHDVLFWLNGTFLDNQHQPIQILTDNGDFILSTLTAFVEEQMQRRGTEDTAALLLNWNNYTQDVSAHTKEHPLLTWLGKVFPSPAARLSGDEPWKTACMHYLEKQCHMHGLNPKDLPIQTYIDAIESIPIPSPYPKQALDILQKQPLPIEASMEQLIRLRNDALLLFKQSCKASDWYTKTEAASNLFTVLDAVDVLYGYRRLSLHIVAEDAIFQDASAGLIGVLVDYFTNYSLDKALPEALTAAQTRYRAQEKAFLDDNQVDFITNFFHIATAEATVTWGQAFARFKAIHARRSLFLSDEALRTWHLESLDLTSEGLLVNNITPYYVNRILLQATLVSITQWSETYANYLVEVTDWLLQPAPLGEGLFNSFRSSYYPMQLANLCCLALIARNPSITVDIKAEVLQTCIVLSAPKYRSYLPTLVGTLGPVFWNAMQDRLPILIVDGSQLVDLLRVQQLTESQITQIWNAVQDRLPMLIGDIKQLIDLLCVSRLTEAQRIQIWNAAWDRLSMLIGDKSQLATLLSVSYLTETQRTQILNAVQDRLPMLMVDAYKLASLLGASYLTETHRTQILNAVQDKLPLLIENQLRLASLLRIEFLTETHRTQIFHAVRDKLSMLIDDAYQLAMLLRIAHLTETQRTQILHAVQDRLPMLITKEIQLSELMAIPYLTEMQKNLIQNALPLPLVKSSKGNTGPMSSGYNPTLFPVAFASTVEALATIDLQFE